MKFVEFRTCPDPHFGMILNSSQALLRVARFSDSMRLSCKEENQRAENGRDSIRGTL